MIPTMGEETQVVTSTTNGFPHGTKANLNGDQPIEKTVEFERTLITENGTVTVTKTLDAGDAPAVTAPVVENEQNVRNTMETSNQPPESGLDSSKQVEPQSGLSSTNVPANPPLPSAPPPAKPMQTIAATPPVEKDNNMEVVPTSAATNQPPLPSGTPPTSSKESENDTTPPTAAANNSDASSAKNSEAVSKPAASAVIRPSLRGKYSVSDDGSGVWEGRWGMDDKAFSEGGITSPFSYTSEVLEAEASNSLNIRSAVFSGYFMLGSSIPGKQPTKHVEKGIKFEFKDSTELGDGVLKVAGTGSNAFGSFELDGRFVVSSGEMNVYRSYTGPPVKNQRGRKSKKNSGAGRPKRPRAEVTAGVAKPPVGVKGKRPGEKRLAALFNSLPTVSERTGRIRRAPSHLVEDTLDSPDAGDKLGQMKLVVRNLLANDKEGWFSVPVDPKALGILNYFDIIKKPMDLGTIKDKLESSDYESQEEVVEDIRLVFNNACTFNPKGHPVHRVAAQHLKLFENEFKKLLRKQNSKAKAKLSKQKQKKEKAKEDKAGSGGDGRRKRPAKEINGAKSTASSRKSAVKHSIFSSSDDDDDNEEDDDSDDDFEKERRKRKKQKKQKRREAKKRKSSGEPAEMKMLRKQVEMMNKQIAMMQKMQENQMAFQMNSAAMQHSIEPQSSRSPATVSKPKKKEVPLSYQEKRQLGQDIHKLPGDKIQGVISIIEECGAPMGQEGDEVELDIEALDTPALRKLQVYVRKALKRTKKSSNIDSLVMA